ncbi:hypothetical protein [Amnibacterium kyonggiense]|uniref:Uncharacterized protein n=1 Tax=Amnibacterium kyonggiense TaxID=595671 RepID=A0A4R7FPD4_9MICO|nr:hypothetical protein [Amnibacterium kyonggiense]TDS79516.1 hypothetical protein CLV52_0045 [Amnibacterium kyonggiense]
MTFADVLERPSVRYDASAAEEWFEVEAPAQVTPQVQFAAAFAGMIAAIDAGERPSVEVDWDAIDARADDRDEAFEANVAERWDE